MILYNTGDFFAFRAELGTNFARNSPKNTYDNTTLFNTIRHFWKV